MANRRNGVKVCQVCGGLRDAGDPSFCAVCRELVGRLDTGNRWVERLPQDERARREQRIAAHGVRVQAELAALERRRVAAIRRCA